MAHFTPSTIWQSCIITPSALRSAVLRWTLPQSCTIHMAPMLIPAPASAGIAAANCPSFLLHPSSTGEYSYGHTFSLQPLLEPRERFWLIKPTVNNLSKSPGITQWENKPILFKLPSVNHSRNIGLQTAPIQEDRFLQLTHTRLKATKEAFAYLGLNETIRRYFLI